MMRLERSRLPVLEKKMGQPPPTRRKKVYLCAAARGKTLSRLYLHTSCARYNKFVFPEISKRYLPTYFQTVLARGNLAGQIGRWERPSYAVPIKMHSTGGPVAATTAVDSHGSSHQSKPSGYASKQAVRLRSTQRLVYTVSTPTPAFKAQTIARQQRNEQPPRAHL